MNNLELRKPYQLQQIIDIISKEIYKNGLTNNNFCLYANGDTLKANLICYLELYPTISDDDEEIYPNFVTEESLLLVYYGEQFEDVLLNVLGQKNSPSIEDYISALDYYSKYDEFKEFK